MEAEARMSPIRISYSVNEAAKAAGIGLTKLRQEIRENRSASWRAGRQFAVVLAG